MFDASVLSLGDSVAAIAALPAQLSTQLIA